MRKLPPHTHIYRNYICPYRNEIPIYQNCILIQTTPSNHIHILIGTLSLPISLSKRYNPFRNVRCGSTYTHVEASGGYGGSGTSGMLNHLSKKHIPEHAAIMRANALASKKNNPDGERLAQKAFCPPPGVTGHPTPRHFNTHSN